MSNIYTVVQCNEPPALWAEQARSYAELMAQSSQYWTPEFIEQYQQSTPTPLIAGQLLRFNTPQSRFEKVHRLNGGSLSVVANARLDNREALFQLLQQVPDSKIADGLLIGLLYQRLGIELLQHLLGDFAFIIWDEAQQQLIAACDHFGVKNLFYGDCDLGLMVTNEHKALLTAPGMDNRINPDYLVRQWLTLPDVGYVSPCMGIKSIPPAHYLLANKDGANCYRYWNLASRDYPEFKTREQSIAGLRQRFELAVKRRLQTEFNLGAELSEGLDSTAICAVAAKAVMPKLVLTFSYDGTALNENNAATYRDILDFVAMYDNIQPQWRETPVTLSEDELSQLIASAFGAPAPQSGQWLERYPLITAAGVRTLLSGWGGDHCVTSYADFYEDELLGKGEFFKLIKLLKHKYHRGRGGRPLRTLVRLLLKHGLPKLYRRFLLAKSPLILQLKEKCNKQPLKQRWVSVENLTRYQEFIEQYDSQSVKARDWRELFVVGVHWRLFGSEVIGRFFGIDYRFPMLDKELVEYVYSMPSAYKIWQGVERSMYRDAITGLVTERIRTRLKSDVIQISEHDKDKKRIRYEKLLKTTNELYQHPVTQCFFEQGGFLDIPKNFCAFPMITDNLDALKVVCELYDKQMLQLPTSDRVNLS